MSHLFGISCDGQSSPEISLHGEPPADGAEATGWGLAWYSKAGAAAAVIRDPVATGSDTALSRVLRDWDRLRSSLVLGHIRVAANRVEQEDTHPFHRSTAGRDFIFAHDGHLDVRQLSEFQLGDPPDFEPVGRTDSEYAFCWLLTQLRERGARLLSEMGYATLHGLFQELNHFGSANFLIADGEDLIAYRDAGGKHELYALRRTPPHDQTRLRSDYVDIDLHDPVDATRTHVVVSSSPIQDLPARLLEPGEMIVVKQGAFIWTSTVQVELQSQVGAPLPMPVPAPLPEGMDEAAAPPPSSDATPVPTPVPAPGNAQRQDISPSESPPSTASLLYTGLIGGSERPSFPPPPPSPLNVRKARERVLSVVHETVYRYVTPISKSAHTYRLRPEEDLTQQVLSFSLDISPSGASYTFQDVFGNYTTRMNLREPYQELRVVSRSSVRVMDTPEPPSPLGRTTIPLLWMPWQRQMMDPYLLPPELPESELKELSAYAMSFARRQNHDLLATLKDINVSIYRDFAYVSQSTTAETTPFEVYVNRVGVCQDFANLFICLARLLGVPARYRVGYIFTGGDYENKIQSDASHAWAELYLPRVGWRGFDPTNGCLTGLDHVRVASGRNYRDATPTSGTIFQGGGGETLEVAVRVEAEGEPISRSRP